MSGFDVDQLKSPIYWCANIKNTKTIKIVGMKFLRHQIWLSKLFGTIRSRQREFCKNTSWKILRFVLAVFLKKMQHKIPIVFFSISTTIPENKLSCATLKSRLKFSKIAILKNCGQFHDNGFQEPSFSFLIKVMYWFRKLHEYLMFIAQTRILGQISWWSLNGTVRMENIRNVLNNLNNA